MNGDKKASGDNPEVPEPNETPTEAPPPDDPETPSTSEPVIMDEPPATSDPVIKLETSFDLDSIRDNEEESDSKE